MITTPDELAPSWRITTNPACKLALHAPQGGLLATLLCETPKRGDIWPVTLWRARCVGIGGASTPIAWGATALEAWCALARACGVLVSALVPYDDATTEIAAHFDT